MQFFCSTWYIGQNLSRGSKLLFCPWDFWHIVYITRCACNRRESEAIMLVMWNILAISEQHEVRRELTHVSVVSRRTFIILLSYYAISRSARYRRLSTLCLRLPAADRVCIELSIGHITDWIRSYAADTYSISIDIGIAIPDPFFQSRDSGLRNF